MSNQNQKGEKKMPHQVIIKSFDNPESRIIRDLEILKKHIERFRGLGCKISMTMGVFDLLHIGHVKYMEETKARGDISIVGVDSDELTQQRKGPNRPLVPEEERLQMVCRYADLVTVNNTNEDVNHLIKIVRPDVLVVSRSTRDFKTRYQDLQTFVGEVVELDPMASTSTTNRFRNIVMEGKLKLIEELERVFEKHKDDKKEGEQP